jgi:hypothetical protein
MRSCPSTTPTLSVVLITLRALKVIAPVRSGSPEAVPVYLPLVIVIVLPSVVVHVRVDVLAPVAVNVAATAFAVLPSMPWATAMLVPSRAASPAAMNVNLRMNPPGWDDPGAKDPGRAYAPCYVRVKGA